MNNRLLHTPEGMRDVNPSEYLEKLKISDSMLRVMSDNGFMQIQTPSFEYFDVFSDNIGMTPSRELYKFYDKEGNTLVLRPDFTPSIARAYAKLYYEESSPVRLSYSGNTFVNSHDYDGRLKESTQIGAELYNDASEAADAQIILLMIKCMQAADFNDFVITLGNVEFFKGLCEEYGISDKDEMVLHELISDKNYFTAEEMLKNMDLSDEVKHLIVHISESYSSIDKINELMGNMKNERCKAALKRLIDIYEILVKEDLHKYIIFDNLDIVNEMIKYELKKINLPTKIYKNNQ